MATQIITSYEDWKSQVNTEIEQLGQPSWIDYPEELSRLSHSLGQVPKDWATIVVSNRSRLEVTADDGKWEHV